MESLYRQLKFISNTQLGKRFWKSDALRGEKCTAAVSTLTPDETTGDIDGNTIKDGTLVILMTKKNDIDYNKADGEDIPYWTGDRNGSDVQNVGNEGNRWWSFNNISVPRQFREQVIQSTLQDVIFT